MPQSRDTIFRKLQHSTRKRTTFTFEAEPGFIQRLYKETGIKDVDVKTYPGVRHELLNESNKEEVMSDVISYRYYFTVVRIRLVMPLLAGNPQSNFPF